MSSREHEREVAKFLGIITKFDTMFHHSFDIVYYQMSDKSRQDYHNYATSLMIQKGENTWKYSDIRLSLLFFGSRYISTRANSDQFPEQETLHWLYFV